MAKKNRNNTHNTPKQEADSLHRKAKRLAKKHTEMEEQTELTPEQSLSEMVSGNVLRQDRSFIIREDDKNGEVLGELSKANIERGIEILEKDYPDYYSDVLTEDYDAESADIFFQLAVMGEVVYG